jgi:hypothetical protein
MCGRREDKDLILLYGAEGHTTGGYGCVASEDGALFVARRAMNLHGCAPASMAPFPQIPAFEARCIRPGIVPLPRRTAVGTPRSGALPDGGASTLSVHGLFGNGTLEAGLTVLPGVGKTGGTTQGGTQLWQHGA